jgi:hypothetical protein
MADDKTNDAPAPPAPPAPAVAQPSSATATAAPAKKPVTASDKAQRAGGAYVQRGRWVDAHGAPLSDEEVADRKLPSLPKTDQPIVQPGAGVVEAPNS